MNKFRTIFLWIVTVLLFASCEKYELESNPQLNLNGRWDVVDIDVVIDNVNYDSEVTVTSEDQASVGSFYVTGVDSQGNLLLTQDFESTIINRRFDIDDTQWEFDYYDLRITDGLGDEWIPIDFPCVYCTERTILENDYMGEKTRYTFSLDTYGAMPSNVLKLTSQVFYTNILIDGNQYDKAIESHLEITLHKF